MNDGYTWGRAPDAEAVAARAIAAVRSAALSALPADSYRAVLLVGGYGRGEGGVVRRSGQPYLHNNLDLLVVATGRWRFARHVLADRLRSATRRLVAQLGVGIDVGAIADWTLERGPCRVFYYDLRHGHRTIAGDPTFAPGLSCTVDRIVPEDMLALVANRGTLLAINRELVARGLTKREVLAKHIAKAILGYGDGWLWTRGRYHWSYGERLRRIEGSPAPTWLIDLYASAARWRFQPESVAFGTGDLARWNEELIEQCEVVHRSVVAHVDGSFASWAEQVYPRTFQGFVRRRLGRAPLARLFPLVAYRPTLDGLRCAARALASQPDARSVRAAYLKAWGIDGDPNFQAAATSMGLAS